MTRGSKVGRKSGTVNKATRLMRYAPRLLTKSFHLLAAHIDSFLFIYVTFFLVFMIMIPFSRGVFYSRRATKYMAGVFRDKLGRIW
jgi:hypothetical protein